MALTGAQIMAFRKELEAKRDELDVSRTASADARQPVNLDQQSVGRVSRIDAMQHQAMAQAHERQRSQHLVRIEQALRRIKTGRFGYCPECEEEIAPKRTATGGSGLPFMFKVRRKKLGRN